MDGYAVAAEHHKWWSHVTRRILVQTIAAGRQIVSAAGRRQAIAVSPPWLPTKPAWWRCRYWKTNCASCQCRWAGVRWLRCVAASRRPWMPGTRLQTSCRNGCHPAGRTTDQTRAEAPSLLSLRAQTWRVRLWTRRPSRFAHCRRSYYIVCVGKICGRARDAPVGFGARIVRAWWRRARITRATRIASPVTRHCGHPTAAATGRV